MAKIIQAIRGMNDILPDQIPIWQYIEQILKKVVESYGYQEIRLPIVEYTDLFKRVVGETTDIVQKEMYTFEDHNGDHLSLRPEGTAGCVRAGIEHGLLYNQIQRFWYFGPLFRHERPQKGRYRQFYQLGVEAFGMATPEIDAEMILICARIWKLLGLSKAITLQINSLGSVETRQVYRKALVDYFSEHKNKLDEDSLRRLQKNPLRILDSKDASMKSVIQNAPKLIDYLDETAKKYFEDFCHLLDVTEVSYEINPYLVRGLDYYTHTVFEWVTDRLGAQGTVCAGGRFDGLVEQMGGKSTPAVGFAMGIERLVALMVEQKQAPKLDDKPHIYFIAVGNTAKEMGLALAEQLRDKLPMLRLIVDHTGGQFKNQFKRSDKSGAVLALILGEEEVAREKISVKFLRENRPQKSIENVDVISFLREYLHQE